MMTTTTARLNGRCSICARPTRPGDTIRRAVDGWAHDACASKPMTPAKWRTTAVAYLRKRARAHGTPMTLNAFTHQGGNGPYGVVETFDCGTPSRPDYRAHFYLFTTAADRDAHFEAWGRRDYWSGTQTGAYMFDLPVEA